MAYRGPESAGSSPRPVCYGLAHREPDHSNRANLVGRRLGADRFLGG